MREFLQAGVELLGARGRPGPPRSSTVLCEALDATGLRDYRDRDRRRRALPRADGRARGGRRHRRRVLLEALVRRDFVAARARGRPPATSAPRRPTCSCACPRSAAGSTCSTPSTRPSARPARRAPRPRTRGRRPPDLRPRARARPGLLHRRGVRGLRPGRGDAARGRRALRRPAGALRARRCPRSASRSRVDRLHIALAGEEGRGEA